MNYYELECKVYLKRDIEINKSFNIINKFISFSLARGGYEEFHNKNIYKMYVFNSLYPFTINEPYKKGKIYSFKLRTIDFELAKAFQKNLPQNTNNPDFMFLESPVIEFKQKFITELKTITPTIITTQNREFWSLFRDGDILTLQKQLHNNLEKKYKQYFNEEIKPIQNFIQHIEVLNKKQQSIEITKNQKPFKLWGNKFKIIPNDDEISQKLATLAMAVGLGEKNAYGAGFCMAKIVKNN